MYQFSGIGVEVDGMGVKVSRLSIFSRCEGHWHEKGFQWDRCESE